MKKNVLLLIGFLLFTLFTFSQEITKKVINDFETKTQAKISFNKNLKTPGFIKFPINKPYPIAGTSLKEKTNTFLTNNKSMFAIDNVNESLKDGIAKTDNYGLKHYTVKQYYKGVPVYDSQLRFHFDKNENLRSVNGTIISDIKVNSIPKLTKINANTVAINLINNQNINQSGEPLKVITNKLYIFPKGLVQGNVISKHLAYRIEVRNDMDVREYLFVDAHTGEVVEQFTGMAHVLSRKVYKGDFNLLRYKDFPLPASSTFFLNQDEKNLVATAAHTYYFFEHAFGFTSYDNADAEMIAVSEATSITNCPNANWNGATINFCDGMAADDVVAHEWGHAYTQYTSNLIYSYESGALNESYSDIWGETIDILNNYEDAGEDLSIRSGSTVNNRWQMGEDGTALGVIRDMWNPLLHGNPDKITANNYWCDSGDNGGVHINSGIPNRAYSLLVDGGLFNGQTISGIGFTKAAHIFWRANSEYLTASSGFSVFADAIEQSCTDLLGINLEGLSTTDTPFGPSGEILTAADYNELVKVLLAVELRTENECVYATILAPSTDLCGAATTNPVFLEDWESGLGAWTVSQLPEDAGTWQPRDWTIETTLPHGRAGQAIYATDALVGDNCQGADFENGIIRLESPTITMPNYTEGTFSLAFNHSFSSEAGFDGGNIKYSLNAGTWTILPASAFTENPYNSTLDNTDNNDNPMKGEEAFSGIDGGPGVTASEWGQSTIDLSALGVTANSDLQLRWEFGTDACNGEIGWFVDEIVIYNCAEALSINDFEFLDNNVSIYPNPSSGTFNIEMKSISDFRYDIYDITGKAIMNRVDIINNAFEVNLKDYSKGVYFFKLYSSQGSVTKKLIIQ